MDLPYYREYELAWTNTEQEQKFHRLLLTVLAIACVLGVAWPWIPTPSLDPEEIVEIPPRIAKLLLEHKPPPPPPPAPREEIVEPEPVPVAEETVERVVEREPEPVPEPVRETVPEPDRTQRARERAQAALLPFTESLASLRDNDIVERVADERPLTASASAGPAPRNERSMITSRVGAASGGINTAAMSRNTGGVGLGERQTTQVENPVANIGSSAGEGPVRSGTSSKASRSREEIELVFDRNKGAIFALYNRALRSDPTLQGKLVLRLTIAPSGEVTFCEVVSSELNNPEMEEKLVQRVLLFRFEPKDVEPITTTKPIDFFPA